MTDNSRDVQTTEGPPAWVGMQVYAESARWLRAWLAERGVHLQKASEFGRGIAMVEILGEALAAKAPVRIKGDEIVLAMNAAIAAHAVHRAQSSSPQLVDSWTKLFRGADLSLARRGPNTLERDQMWELFIASAATHVFDDVRMGGSRNPDVAFTIDGRKWGVECKMLYTRVPGPACEKLTRKTSQLRSAPIEKGWVVVNVSNAIDHDFGDRQRWRPTTEIGESTRALQQSVLATRSGQKLRRALAKADGPVRGIIFVGLTVFQSPSAPILSAVVNLYAEFRQDRDDQRCLERLRAGIMKSLGMDGAPPPGFPAPPR